MKRSAMVLAVLLSFLLAAAATEAKDYEVVKKAGDYEVMVLLDKDPPVAGANMAATITVKDAAGALVTDAKVTLVYSMAAMPGMPPMNYNAEAELTGTKFKAPIKFSMSGPWTVSVKVLKDSKTSSMKFSVDVQ